jgi:hypothetical protein
MARERDQPKLEHVRRGALTLYEARCIRVIRQQGGKRLRATRIGRPFGELPLPKIEHGFRPLIDLCSARHPASISTRWRFRQSLAALQQYLRGAAFLRHTC